MTKIITIEHNAYIFYEWDTATMSWGSPTADAFRAAGAAVYEEPAYSELEVYKLDYFTAMAIATRNRADYAGPIIVKENIDPATLKQIYDSSPTGARQLVPVR